MILENDNPHVRRVTRPEPMFPKLPKSASDPDYDWHTDRENIFIAREVFAAEADMLDMVSRLEKIDGMPSKKQDDWYYKLTKMSERYEELAVFYMDQMQHDIDVEVPIIRAKGMVVEMYSELWSYENKYGKTEATDQRRNRLLLIQGLLEQMEKQVSKYMQAKIIMIHAINKNADLQKENNELKRQLKNIQDAEEWSNRENA